MNRNHRISVAAFALVFGLAAYSGTASAQARSSHFGIGGVVGDPFGLTMKLRTNSSFSMQFLAGWEAYGYHRYWNGNGFQVSADFLWAIDIRSLRRTEFAFYFGVGPQLELVSWNNHPNDHSDIFFGARVPLGLSWDFKNRPLDVYFELVPAFLFGDHWDDDNDPNFFFEGDWGAGARYWF